MTQEQVSKNTSQREDAEVADLPAGDTSERVAKLDAETDDILADIDKILEPNAQDFVDAFVQRGGE